MVALSVMKTGALVGIAAATLILFGVMLDLTLNALRQWWDAAPLFGGEDLSTNEERER